MRSHQEPQSGTDKDNMEQRWASLEHKAVMLQQSYWNSLLSHHFVKKYPISKITGPAVAQTSVQFSCTPRRAEVASTMSCLNWVRSLEPSTSSQMSAHSLPGCHEVFCSLSPARSAWFRRFHEHKPDFLSENKFFDIVSLNQINVWGRSYWGWVFGLVRDIVPSCAPFSFRYFFCFQFVWIVFKRKFNGETSWNWNIYVGLHS